MKKAGRIGMTFGVFDGLHKGHKRFFAYAQERCDELYVAVAPDEVVRTLKGKAPQRTLEERMKALEAYDRSLNVIEGDEALRTWKVLRNVRPDLVFLGYDQQSLTEEIRALSVHIETAPPYEPETYKSSFFSKKGAV